MTSGALLKALLWSWWALCLTAPGGANNEQTLVIEVPSGPFCEIDGLAECRPGDCIRFDPLAVKRSPSVATSRPDLNPGWTSDQALGPAITVYVTLLLAHLEMGLEVFSDRLTVRALEPVLEVGGPGAWPAAGGPARCLQDSLCEDWREVQFENVPMHVGQIPEAHRVGRALNIRVDPVERSTGEWRRLLRKHRSEVFGRLRFRRDLEDRARALFRTAARKMSVAPQKLTFVGIDLRRVAQPPTGKVNSDDDDEDDEEDEEYFLEAVEHFNDEFGAKRTAFLAVAPPDSDSRGSRRPKFERLRKVRNVFFLDQDGGHGSSADAGLAVLFRCNHTVQALGEQDTVGLWAAIAAGGQTYTQYGPLPQEAILP